MWRTILNILNRFRISIFAFLYICFIIYAWNEVQAISALPATRWMNIFNFGPFSEWENVMAYFRDLRTGVPPFLSAMEVISFYASGSSSWVVEEFYRICIILMLVLPVFLTKARWGEVIGCLLMAYLFLKSILVIAPMNPQLYDIALPTFLLIYLIFSQISFQPKSSNWLTIFMAFLAGFFLSMAELSRPFMLLLVPFLIIYNFYGYRKMVQVKMPQADQYTSNRKDAKGGAQRSQRNWFLTLFGRSYAFSQLNLRKVIQTPRKAWTYFLIFLFPIALFSGVWHLKLLIYNDGQIVWSNHSGFNLANAWPSLVDWDELADDFLPEAKPLEDNPWTWDNINTKEHYENSKIRQRGVIQGIFAHPWKALARFGERVVIFTEPRTDMYAGNPQGPVINMYKAIVHCLFWVLGFLLIRSLVMIYRNWRYIFSSQFVIIFIGGFMCLMPIIGENGEEARFTLSVLSLLMLGGVIFGDIVFQFLRNKIPEPKSFSST